MLAGVFVIEGGGCRYCPRLGIVCKSAVFIAQNEIECHLVTFRVGDGDSLNDRRAQWR